MLITCLGFRFHSVSPDTRSSLRRFSVASAKKTNKLYFTGFGLYCFLLEHPLFWDVLPLLPYRSEGTAVFSGNAADHS